MSASVEGYSYDIFISYRQNDNKYDGWVSEFYTNLKKELEATVKEKLTIYFDENPVDGLLEIHSVNPSLESKLKCLIFIPVISHTYCDTKSYAWQKEFLAFNDFSQNDGFGREIRLINNNVTSRILPVKIHELEPEDTALLEHELGGKLRHIDFIYKSPGVNRPLRAHEDHPKNNLNKTYYRDQNNKVANAIKEILIGLKSQSSAINKDAKAREVPVPAILRVNRKLKTIAVIMILLTILILGFLFIPGSLKPSHSIEKSIAVLPFRNDSPNDSNTYFINGIMEEILNNLQKIKDMRIISRTSVEQYRNTSKTIPQIAKELDVNYVVEGSGQRFGNSFRINVQLIRAKKEDYLWGDLYEQKISNAGDIINVQSTIAKAIVSELRGTITPQEKLLIETVPTTSLTAYDFYQKGKEEFSKYWIDQNNKKALLNAENLFSRALESDPGFAKAIVGEAEVFWNKNTYMKRASIIDTVLMMADRAISYDDKIAEAYVIKGWCYDDAGEYDKALKQYSKAIELNPNNWKAYYGLANLYYFEDPVKSLYNLNKAVALTHGTVEMPTLLRYIGGELLVTGYLEKAGTYFSRAFELDGDSAIYFSCLAGIEQNQGNYKKALGYYNQAYRMKEDYTDVLNNLALIYQLTGNYDESIRYYKELESQNNLTFNLHRAGYAYIKNGFKEEGNNYINKHIEYCNSVLKGGSRSDALSYSYYDLAGIYGFRGDKKKALHNLQMFSQVKNCYLYMLTLLRNDPLLEGLKEEPEFKKILKDMEIKYDKVHSDVGAWLSKQTDF